MKEPTSPGLHIHRIKAIDADTHGSKIVLKVDGRLHDTQTELEFAVTTDLAPAMALALLATTAKARAARDDLQPALQVLAAAVVRSSSTDRVRLQLLFDKGAVLPLEMTPDAGRALSAGLVEYFDSPQRRYIDNGSAQ